MTFNRTKINFKLEKKVNLLLAVISYLFIVGLLGLVTERIFTLGNLSYVLSFFGIQALIGAFNNFIEKDIIKDFFKDWKELPLHFHLLIIFNCLIYFNFINLINPEEYESKRF